MKKQKIRFEMITEFIEIPKVQLKKIKGGLGDTGGETDDPPTHDGD